MGVGQKVAQPSRGEVCRVNFDPTLGAEIRKTRPALILQNDIANRHSPITIVAAITPMVGEKVYPTEVPVKVRGGGLTSDSVVRLNQIRSVDRRRLVKRLGIVETDTMNHINRALQISLGMIDF